MGEDQCTITAWQLTYRARGSLLPVMLILHMDLYKPYGPLTGFAAGVRFGICCRFELSESFRPTLHPFLCRAQIYSWPFPGKGGAATISDQEGALHCFFITSGKQVKMDALGSPLTSTFVARCLTQFVFMWGRITLGYPDLEDVTGWLHPPLPSKLIKTTFAVILYQTWTLRSPLSTSCLAAYPVVFPRSSSVLGKVGWSRVWQPPSRPIPI